MGRISCLLACLASFFVAEGPGDRAKHQGTWAVTSMVREGKEADATVAASIVRVVEGDHIVWKRSGKSFAGTNFDVDATKIPATIDLIPDGGPAQDKRVLGIYRLDGETLTICVADVGQPRPVAFEAGEASKRTLQTFKRIKP